MALLDNILTFVNRERDALGLPTLAELPVGIPGDDHDCVLGRCFNSPRHTAIAGSYATHVQDHLDDDRTITIGHPDYVRAFVVAFDHGRYPELIDEAA